MQTLETRSFDNASGQDEAFDYNCLVKKPFTLCQFIIFCCQQTLMNLLSSSFPFNLLIGCYGNREMSSRAIEAGVRAVCIMCSYVVEDGKMYLI